MPDSSLAKAATVAALFDLFWKPPKPGKLAEKLAVADTLASLPNVKLVSRRVGYIDKEKEIGRWKVIEQELLDRGLPLRG